LRREEEKSMQITLNISDKILPFEKMIDVIRKKKLLSAIKVTFHRDDHLNLFYEIGGDVVDDEKISDQVIHLLIFRAHG